MFTPMICFRISYRLPPTSFSGVIGALEEHPPTLNIKSATKKLNTMYRNIFKYSCTESYSFEDIYLLCVTLISSYL